MGGGKQKEELAEFLIAPTMELRVGTKLEALDYTGNWWESFNLFIFLLSVFL